MMNGENWSKAARLGGLRRFAIAITIFNVLGHTFFGFEQSIAQPLAALAAAYGMETLLEIIDARMNHRATMFAGGPRNVVDFLLSAHISGLAVAMLLYANDSIWVIIFATSVAIGSKSLLRARAGLSTRHFFNPSNFGITITLLAFPWVGIAPPYHFTENLDGAGDWILPALIIASGTMLNARFTKKLPLIAAWVGGFIVQAGLRSFILGTPLMAALLPMTGVAFILYTFYMVTDPATTPNRTGAQVVFGAAVAAVYAILLALHVVFGLFFALSIVCAIRGLYLYVFNWAERRSSSKVAISAAAQAAR